MNAQLTPRGAASTHKTEFRPDIEGLRGIAVLLVVLYHATVPGWSGGFVGVDVFFVLSGFLITGLLVRELERTATVDFGQFYARRARRLLPASAFVVAVTVLVSALILSPVEQLDVGRTAEATATYASNLYFLAIKGDYFARGTEGNPLVHTWSLSVEEQFYFVWPALLLTTARLTRSRRAIGTVLGVVVVASFVACAATTRYRQPWAFFGTPFRAWEFGVGGLASLIPVAHLVRWTRILTWIGWTGLAALVGAALLFTKSTPFPGIAALLPVLGTCAMLLAGTGPGVRMVLANRVLQRVGRYSYSWYLLHWPVIVFAGALVPSLSLGVRVSCMALAFALAVALHHALENPVRFHPMLAGRPARSLIGAMLLTCVSVAIGASGRRVGWWAGRQSDQRAITAAASDRTPLWNSGCMAMFTQAVARGCAFGNPSSSTIVVLFGDSHAAQWFSGVDSAARLRDWHGVAFVKASCPAARVPIYNPEIGRVERECAMWREDALRQIVALHPTVVIMAGSRAYIAGRRARDGYAQLSYDEWQQGVRATAGVLDSAHVRTLVLADTPWPHFNVPVCLARAVVRTGRMTDGCDVAKPVGLDSAVQDAERAAIAGLRRVAIVDFTDQLCNGNVCQAVRDGRIVYHDESHLTATFAGSVAPVLSDRIVGALSKLSN